MDKQLKIGSVLSYAQLGIKVIISLIYTPLMIRLLGKSEYGLYNTVSSTISLLAIISLGFGSGYIKYYAQYKAQDDREKISKLNGMFIIVFSIIGAISLFCGIFLANHLSMVFDKGLTDSEMVIAKKLMLLLTINLSISFPMTVFSIIISAHERFIFLKIIGTIKSVAGPLVTIPLLLMGYGSVAIVLVTITISLIVDSIFIFYVFIKLHEKFVFRGFEQGLFKKLFSFTVFIAINIIVDNINWNIDKVLLARYKGTLTVAVYAVGASLQSYYNTFSTAISGIFTPRIHHIINTYKDTVVQNKVLSDLFTKIGRIQFVILALICTGFIFFGKEFIFFWVGEGYDESYFVALLLMIPVTIPLIQNLGIEIQRARNKHQFRSLVYLGMAFCNFFLTIFLCRIYGAVGAAVGTAISFVVANGLIMNVFYFKQCGINIPWFWKEIALLAKGVVIPIVFGVIIKRFFSFYSWGMFIAGIVFYVSIFCISMFFIGIKSEERENIKDHVSTVLRKLRFGHDQNQ